MRRIDTIIRALIGATVLIGGLAALTPAAQADTPIACSENALVAAINLANSTPAADPITANTPNNCVGSVPAVPNCTG